MVFAPKAASVSRLVGSPAGADEIIEAIDLVAADKQLLENVLLTKSYID